MAGCHIIPPRGYKPEFRTPFPLVDGWWLDRQGIGKGYQFTRYTFEEYSQLKETPSAETLLESVIPGACRHVYAPIIGARIGSNGSS